MSPPGTYGLPRHPKKEIEAVIREAEEHGWERKPAKG